LQETKKILDIAYLQLIPANLYQFFLDVFCAA